MKKILSLVFCLISVITYAQRDTEFWFAAPDVDVQHQEPIVLRITSYSSASVVTVSQPANVSFTPITVSVPANSSTSVDLTTWINSIENSNPNVVSNKGILVTATSDISVYYEVVSGNPTCPGCNPELFALKGKNAIGNEFIIPTQTVWAIDTIRYPSARSAFDIVATDDNTVVSIVPSKPLMGRAAGIPFSVVLNKGQTFSCQGLYRNKENMLSGSIVTSSKPVAVTEKEDLLFADGACADLTGDQLVPLSIWGNEFVVVRGDLLNRDRVVVTAAFDNTEVFLNGSSTPVAVINKSNSYEFDLVSTTTVYIKTSNKASVLHYTGLNCENSSAIIPKLNCTGSKDVSIVKSINESAIVFIVTKAGNEGSFLVNGNPGVLTSADFSTVPGASGYVFCKKEIGFAMPLGIATRITNTSGIFQLGFLNGSSPSIQTGCRYGYFSDFKSTNVQKSQTTVCRYDSVQLNAFGGISYQWFPSSGLSSTSIANPKASPAITTEYRVVITTAEGCIDSAFVKVEVDQSCAPETIINSYTEVLSKDICLNNITVRDISSFHIGDTVLLIQMKGAFIDSSDNAGFGVVNNYNNAGNYEFNYIKSITGNQIELLNVIQRQYDIINGKVQLVRVPYFQDYSVDDKLTSLAWDGSKGGVLVFNVKNNLVLNGEIDVSGKGFKGAVPMNSSVVTYNQQGYYYNASSNNGGQKGEGIHTLTDSKNYGRGAPSNAGGGGNAHNAGGGGGANAGAGGIGGDQWEGGKTITEQIGGKGGHSLVNNATLNRLFLGGGGGMGHGNDRNEYPAGNGGGIIIISANSITSNGNSIRANGDSGIVCTGVGSCNDGMSGGGAGGTILIDIANASDIIKVEAKGGRGANSLYLHPVDVNNKVGTGGGGGGGYVSFTSNSINPQFNVNVSGGKAGILINHNNVTYGATDGSDGIVISSFPKFMDDVLFKKNIDSVRISNTALSCNTIDFKGNEFVNSSPIVSWQWSFGDGNISSLQNIAHTYTASNLFNVKLIGTDINGCKDSTQIPLNVLIPSVSLSNDTIICKNTSIPLYVSGGLSYSWSPVPSLSNPFSPTPIVSPVTDMVYYVSINAGSCVLEDSVRVALHPDPVFSISPSTKICEGDSVKLIASGGDIYNWQADPSLSNLSVASPYAFPTASTQYTVFISESTCNNSATKTISIQVNPLPSVKAVKSNDIDCTTGQAQLRVTGANQYSWTPAQTLINPLSASPQAAPLTSTYYKVKGIDNNGCINYDSVFVKVDSSNRSLYLVPNAFTPNNDGINDCFSIKYWGVIRDFDFAIYNRWGERVFHTNDPYKCWDGKYKGMPQATGAFVYIIRAKTNCDSDVLKKGTFLLIR